VIDGVFYDCLESAGVVPEAFFEAVLSISQVQVAGVYEVHGELIVVRVKNDYVTFSSFSLFPAKPSVYLFSPIHALPVCYQEQTTIFRSFHPQVS
jgi:hypothetical protein